MRVLLIGGAGHVGGLILPGLVARHQVRVFDLRAPAESPAAPRAGGSVTSLSHEHVVGDATDADSLAAAMSGMDVVVHTAMADRRSWAPAAAGAAAAFDVHVKSVFVALRLAYEAAVPHAVYISSMSVYRDLLGRRCLTEDDPPDETQVYGLTKHLAERVCHAATVEWGLSVNVLRLAWPTSDEAWPAWSNTGDSPALLHTDDGFLAPALAASDLARAVLAALEHRDGFQAFGVSGDHHGRLVDTSKARALLGWSPERRLGFESRLGSECR